MNLNKTLILLIILLVPVFTLHSQDTTTVEAKSQDIADNLDLEAVASIFGESESLEDFEKRLNDPKSQISNLDLSGDGNVDYLRVVDASEGNTHVVTIQSVIGKDQYQDVATIDVEKDKNGETKVQVVGDVAIYGSNYIIQPVYVQPPVIVTFFWSPLYHPWRSPYYWGYYPPYFHPWRPYPPHVYRRNVHVHVNVHNRYRRTNVRYSSNAARIQTKNRRNDFGTKKPNNSIKTNKPGNLNKSGVNKNKPTKNINTSGKPVQKDWKPSNKNINNNKINKNKSTVPKTKPATVPKTKPANVPKTKPATVPKTKPANVPKTKPAAPKPSSRPKPRVRRR